MVGIGLKKVSIIYITNTYFNLIITHDSFDIFGSSSPQWTPIGGFVLNIELLFYLFDF